MGLIRVQNSVKIHGYKVKVHGKNLRVSPRISMIASCEHTLRDFDFFCSRFCRVPGRGLASMGLIRILFTNADSAQKPHGIK